jgi:hypothetical protein
METRFSTWNIKFIQGILPNDSIERTGQMQVKFGVTAGGHIRRRWERSAGKCTLLYGKKKGNHELGAGFSCIKESY